MNINPNNNYEQNNTSLMNFYGILWYVINLANTSFYCLQKIICKQKICVYANTNMEYLIHSIDRCKPFQISKKLSISKILLQIIVRYDSDKIIACKSIDSLIIFRLSDSYHTIAIQRIENSLGFVNF